MILHEIEYRNQLLMCQMDFILTCEFLHH